MKTTRGIYYNLKESIYKVIYNDVVFYFSSNFYLNKFKETMFEFKLNENIKLNNRYGCIINGDIMLLISLYKKIEKRGFRVLVNGLEINQVPIYYIDIRS